MTLPKYLQPIFLLLPLLLTSCKSTVFHKEGASEVAREAVKPIVRSLDEQTDKLINQLRLDELTYELRELVKTTNQSIQTGEKTVEQLTESLKKISLLTEDVRGLVNNLEDTRAETTELVKTARELLSSVNQLMPEVTRLISNINSVVEEAKNDLTAGTSEVTPAWMKIAAGIIIAIAILIVVFIISSVFKKRK